MESRIEALGWSSEFIGRADELAKLSEQFALAKNGSRAVVIRGPPGIGKTRLVWHFHSSHRGHFHASVQASRNEVELLGPVRRLARRMRTKAASSGNASAVKIADEWLGYLDFSKTRQFSLATASQDAFKRLLRSLSEKKQSIILIDMAQWMERTSLDAVAGLFKAASLEQALFIICIRPGDSDFVRVSEFLDAMRKAGPVSEIELQPLSPKETETLVASALKMPLVPKSLSDAVWDASTGNPRLTVDTLDCMAREGFLTSRGGQWSLSSKSASDCLSKDAETFINERLSQLEPDDRRILSVASVLGETFPLSQLKTIEKDVSTEALARLRSGRWLMIDDDDDVRFFNSDAHKITYDSMDPVSRKSIHKAVYEMRREAGEGALVLAHHILEAGEPLLALQHLDAGSQAAESAYAISFAQEVTGRALELLKSTPDTKTTKRHKLSFQRRMGRCLYHLGDITAAYDRFLEAMELARALDDNAALGECLRWIADILRDKEEYDRAEVEYKKAVRILEREKDRINLSLANIGLGKTYWKLNKYDDALTFIRKGLKIAESEGDQSLLGTAYIDYANVYMDKGDYSECVKHYKMAIEKLTVIDNLEQLARATNNIGEVYKHMGDYASAADSYRRCIDISVKAERLVTRGYGHLNLAEVLAKMGAYDDATLNANLCMGIFERLGEKSLIASCNMVFGLIKQGLGDWKGSGEHFEKAIVLMSGEDAGQFDKGIIILEYARMLKAQGDDVRASDEFNRALEIFERIGAKEMAETVRAELEIKNEAVEQMNRIARDVRSLIKEEVGPMGEFVFRKQCVNLGLDPDSFSKDDLPGIAKAMGDALVMFSGEAKSGAVRDRILKLQRRA